MKVAHFSPIFNEQFSIFKCSLKCIGCNNWTSSSSSSSSRIQNNQSFANNTVDYRDYLNCVCTGTYTSSTCRYKIGKASICLCKAFGKCFDFFPWNAIFVYVKQRKCNWFRISAPISFTCILWFQEDLHFGAENMDDDFVASESPPPPSNCPGGDPACDGEFGVLCEYYVFASERRQPCRKSILLYFLSVWIQQCTLELIWKGFLTMIKKKTRRKKNDSLFRHCHVCGVQMNSSNKAGSR